MECVVQRENVGRINFKPPACNRKYLDPVPIVYQTHGLGILTMEGAKRPIIVFDGECPFCSFWVRFVLKWDKEEIFLFAPAQSNAARNVLDEELLKLAQKTIILIEGGRRYMKSDAILRILGRLRWFWPLAYLSYPIPRVLGDGLYSFVAQRRFQFTKPMQCFLPSETERHRFLE